jgi:hypothetical protein
LFSFLRGGDEEQYWGLKPGPHACLANILPLSYQLNSYLGER